MCLTDTIADKQISDKEEKALSEHKKKEKVGSQRRTRGLSLFVTVITDHLPVTFLKTVIWKHSPHHYEIQNIIDKTSKPERGGLLCRLEWAR